MGSSRFLLIILLGSLGPKKQTNSFQPNPEAKRGYAKPPKLRLCSRSLFVRHSSPTRMRSNLKSFELEWHSRVRNPTPLRGARDPLKEPSDLQFIVAHPPSPPFCEFLKRTFYLVFHHCWKSHATHRDRAL
ncbi:hypothetical protein TNCV_789311 [Trichonephila clavipes]|nr:hypothetical protein TNCV_789311 [Trichonephila clavipes]